MACEQVRAASGLRVFSKGLYFFCAQFLGYHNNGGWKMRPIREEFLNGGMDLINFTRVKSRWEQEEDGLL